MLSAVLTLSARGLQITHVEELGWARDVQWLGASKDHWLLRSPSGVLLTLESSQQGWAMDPDVRLLRKTTANGRRWVCDASLVRTPTRLIT